MLPLAIVAEGRERGREEGREEGIRLGIEGMLRQKLGPSIPGSVLERLQTLSGQRLTELLVAIGDAGSAAAVGKVLEEFFGPYGGSG